MQFPALQFKAHQVIKAITSITLVKNNNERTQAGSDIAAVPGLRMPSPKTISAN
jgi:hypothetical protein